MPVAASMIAAKDFRRSLILSVIYSEAAVIIGVTAAGIGNFAPSGTIVLLLIFMLIATIASRKGVKR